MIIMGEIRKNGKTAWIYGLVFILAMIAFAVVSWLSVCAIVKLITLGLGWTFSWAYATGIWFLLCLATIIAQRRPL